MNLTTQQQNETYLALVQLANHLYSFWQDDQYDFEFRDNFIPNLPNAPEGFKWRIISTDSTSGIIQLDLA